MRGGVFNFKVSGLKVSGLRLQGFGIGGSKVSVNRVQVFRVWRFWRLRMTSFRSMASSAQSHDLQMLLFSMAFLRLESLNSLFKLLKPRPLTPSPQNRISPKPLNLCITFFAIGRFALDCRRLSTLNPEPLNPKP